MAGPHHDVHLPAEVKADIRAVALNVVIGLAHQIRIAQILEIVDMTVRVSIKLMSCAI